MQQNSIAVYFVTDAQQNTQVQGKTKHITIFVIDLLLFIFYFSILFLLKSEVAVVTNNCGYGKSICCTVIQKSNCVQSFANVFFFFIP